jgi:hypothetical protein
VIAGPRFGAEVPAHSSSQSRGLKVAFQSLPNLRDVIFISSECSKSQPSGGRSETGQRGRDQIMGRAR